MSKAHGEIAEPQLRAFRSSLLIWFKKNRRSLPWRSNRTPYRVWISELMLQQTRVDQVEAYYRRFMKRFPSLKQLAAASEQDVLKMWEGLGYYARARNMLRAARIIVTERGGRFPRTYDEIIKLPGIGPYTAAAIGSLAFDLDVAVVDGNVFRVLSRVFAERGDITTSSVKRKMEIRAQTLLPIGKAALFNEAMMELGALVCLPRNPTCGTCPLKRICQAYELDQQEVFPVKKAKAPVPHLVVGAAVTVDSRGRILIAQRKSKGMLGGLWEFPGGKKESNESMQDCIVRELKEELSVETNVGDRILVVRHAYSHFTIELHVHWARIAKGRPKVIDCADFTWVTRDTMRDYPFSRADLHVVDWLFSNHWKT